MTSSDFTRTQSDAELEALDLRASALYEARRYDEAEQAARQYVTMVASRFGEASALYARAIAGLAPIRFWQGDHDDAVALYRRSLAINEGVFGPKDIVVADSANRLGELYQRLGRFSEADEAYSKALMIADQVQPTPADLMVRVLHNYGALCLDGGRLFEAEQYLSRAFRIMKGAKIADQTLILSVPNTIAALWVEQGKYEDAEDIFKHVLSDVIERYGPMDQRVADIYRNLGAAALGRKEFVEAEACFRKALEVDLRTVGEWSANTAKTLNNLGNALLKQEKPDKALPYLLKALAVVQRISGSDKPSTLVFLSNVAYTYHLLKDWARSASYWQQMMQIIIVENRHWRRTAIASRRPDLEGDIAERRDIFARFVKSVWRLVEAGTLGADESFGDTFRAAQYAGVSEAAKSIELLGTRLAPSNQELAGLLRRRYEMLREWQGRNLLLRSLLMMDPAQRNRDAERVIRGRQADLGRAIEVLEETVAERFPDYSPLASLEPLDVEGVRAHLRDEEALVVFHSTPAFDPQPEETFGWLVTKSSARWWRVDLRGKRLDALLHALRCGLDVSAWAEQGCPLLATNYSRDDAMAGRPPPFHLGFAFELYRALLGPAEDAIRGKHLLVVPSGPLTMLPLHVMVTRPPASAYPKRIEEYADADWLIKTNAVTVLPAASSLKMLRQYAGASAATRPYIGFGNPLLLGPNGDDRRAYAVQTCGGIEAPKPRLEFTGWGFLQALAAALRSGADASTLRQQIPLPETAGEVCTIARTLGAGPDDVFLGHRATKPILQSLNASGVLAASRVIHFATHGLMPADTARLGTGLNEAALLLTPPDQASESDNGLLTASDIAQLNLDAEWVILSACNTASGGERGASEPLSGLARAFFYAGARAVLVSHWAVDSFAAVKLTTEAIAAQRSQPSISRAEAVRLSMLRTMIDKSRPANWTPSAHPALWAPFALVGEGSR